jgi:hypothetical protein
VLVAPRPSGSFPALLTVSHTPVADCPPLPSLVSPPLVFAADSAGATLSSRGSEEYATNGTADFTSLQLKGTINQSYALQAS